jgi:hypothetical protein
MLHRFEMRLGKLALRKGLAILLAGLAPLVLRVLLLPWLPAPQPRVQDEFSHLLVADTFAHGRLVNPVHPMWVHFESMHILVRPVYASVYPVAQGIVMAAGQVLVGSPWSGVWFSVGLMCAALCWMLQGWVSPGWALLGGSLAAARFGVLSYWMNSYYGGAMAAVGGALVLGALPRVFRRRRRQDMAVLGIGLAILLNSRPYEGVVFSLPVLAALLWVIRIKARGWSMWIPAAVVVGAAGAAMGCYFASFTGNPLQLPYSFYRNNFTEAPHFVWQAPRAAPVYHHRVLVDYYTGWEMACYNDAHANRSPHGVFDKAKSYWRFCLGPFLTIPFVALPWLWRRRRTRFLLLTGIWFAVALAVEVWHAPQYAAPALGLALLLVVEGLRHLRRKSALLVRAVVVASLLLPVIGGNGNSSDGRERARVLKQLTSMGGRHLVLVRYRTTHDSGDEWVYNAADIDNAAVVWAREMDPTSNRALLRYFQGRRVWLVQPDAAPPLLSPYDPSQPPDPPFRFVKLGTDAIEVLRSPEEIKRKVLQEAGQEFPPPYSFSCDQWNYFFTSVTGVEAPTAIQGCFEPGKRADAVSLDRWFAWLERQR